MVSRRKELRSNLGCCCYSNTGNIEIVTNRIKDSFDVRFPRYLVISVKVDSAIMAGWRYVNKADVEDRPASKGGNGTALAVG